MTPTHSRPPRLHHLDGLRALAAGAVLSTHIFEEAFSSQAPPRLLDRFGPWLQQGHAAVVLFITLSGFCLMLPVLSSGGLRGGARGFFAGRARRILPAYWAAMVFSILVILTVAHGQRGEMFDLSKHLTWKGVLAHALLINNIWPQPSRDLSWAGNIEVNSVFWSIALEWQIYFWFPLLLILWHRISPWPTVILIGLLSWAASHVCHLRGMDVINWPGLNLSFYSCFVLGMLAATIAFAPDQSAARRLPWGWFAAILAVGYAVLIGRFGLYPRFNEDPYSAAFFFCLLLAAVRPGRLQRVLSWRPLVRVGEFSYSVYLLHLPVVAVLTEWVIMPLRPHLGGGALFLLLAALSVPTVLLIAYRFALVFENKRVINRVVERLGLNPPAPNSGGVGPPGPR